MKVCGAVALALFVLALGTHPTAQTFRHVESRDFGRYDSILEVADLNGDGRDDIVVGGRFEAYENGQAEDRFEKSAMRVLFGARSGRFEEGPDGFIQGATIRARRPIVVAADLNGDRRLDLAIFDYGVYVGDESVGIGNPPQLYLTGDDGRLHPSGDSPMLSGNTTESIPTRSTPALQTSTSRRLRPGTSTTMGMWTCGCRASGGPTSRFT